MTACRLGELLRLRKEDAAGDYLTIRKSKTNTARSLPMSVELREVVQSALQDNSGQFVFINRNGVPWTTSGFEAFWRKTLRRADVEHLRAHDLRHAAATRMRRRGFGLDIIAKALGHSTLATTQRYAHVGDAELASALASLEGGQKSGQNDAFERKTMVSIRFTVCPQQQAISS